LDILSLKLGSVEDSEMEFSRHDGAAPEAVAPELAA
jgi:hypothetical protein